MQRLVGSVSISFFSNAFTLEDQYPFSILKFSSESLRSHRVCRELLGDKVTPAVSVLGILGSSGEHALHSGTPLRMGTGGCDHFEASVHVLIQSIVTCS